MQRGLATLLLAALLPGCLTGLLGAEDTPAPDFRLATLEGRNVTLASYSGKILLLDFMATTCEPCKDVTRDLARVAAADPGVVALSVSIQADPDEEAALRAWKSARNASWDHALDRDRVFLRYGGTVIPYLVVVDEDGTIRGRASGATTHAEMQALVRTAKVVG